MRSDFAVLILTHGRPESQLTLQSLEKSGYTGKVYLVVDDEDKCAAEYVRIYGKKVVRF